MVILFRPYLPSDKNIEEYVDENKDTSITRSQCKWIDCGNWFDNLDLLSNHVSKDHSCAGDGGLFYCNWTNCNRGSKGFNARYKMLVHVRTHTNEKPHQCYQCNKSFSRAENLKIHCRSHTGERPYICNVPGCGKAYSNSSDRFKHSRTHTIEKPYVCKIPGCSKKYTDPSSLRKHVKTYKHYITNTAETEMKTEYVENERNEEILNRLSETGDVVNDKYYGTADKCKTEIGLDKRSTFILPFTYSGFSCNYDTTSSLHNHWYQSQNIVTWCIPSDYHSHLEKPSTLEDNLCLNEQPLDLTTRIR